MKEIIYNRKLCLDYAKRYAYVRNPNYYNFDKIGGNCTNYASQCLYAGLPIMNYSPLGWYYNSTTDRSPSWTSVESFCNFLIYNRAVGPYAKLVTVEQIRPADFIQIGLNGNYFHTLVVQSKDNEILVGSNSSDGYLRPLNSYYFTDIRFIKILGGRLS